VASGKWDTNPLPVFWENKRVAPKDYEYMLRGAIVDIRFQLFAYKGSKKRIFNTIVKEIHILKPGKYEWKWQVPISPTKRPAARSAPSYSPEKRQRHSSSDP
jgi:hypothetical protein